MKYVILFGISVILTFTGCTSAEYRKMQAERDQLLRDYEAVREEHNALTLKTEITDSLLGSWRFSDLTLDAQQISEEVAETKAALYALDLEHLTLTFFEENGIHNYRGKNGDTEVSGQFRIITVRYGDAPFPFIRFIRRSGAEIPTLLFAVGSDGTPLGVSRAPGLDTAQEISISVTAERLYLTMHGKMQLSPNGWVQSGGVQCYFERITE